MKMTVRYWQDGACFYLASTNECVAHAPRRVWDSLGVAHDTYEAAQACRAWFVDEWAPERGIRAVFN